MNQLWSRLQRSTGNIFFLLFACVDRSFVTRLHRTFCCVFFLTSFFADLHFQIKATERKKRRLVECCENAHHACALGLLLINGNRANAQTVSTIMALKLERRPQPFQDALPHRHPALLLPSLQPRVQEPNPPSQPHPHRQVSRNSLPRRSTRVSAPRSQRPPLRQATSRSRSRSTVLVAAEVV